MIKFGSDKINNIAYRGTDDIARATLGKDWRMPTYSELQELFNNTTQEYTTIENVSVCKCVAKNGSGKYIVLPIIGNIGYANYWTSSRVESNPSLARYVRIYTDRYLLSSHTRYLKYLIRAVSPTQGIDLGLPSGLRWAECNVGANIPTEIGGGFQWGEMNRNNREIWSNYKFNPSGDGVTFTKYNETDRKTTLELDCDNEIYRVIQDRDIVFNRPIYSSKSFVGFENLSAVSACAVLDALQPVSTPQTITLSAYTTTLINESDVALGKVFDAIKKGWSIVGDGLIQTDDVAFFNDPETRMPTEADFSELINNTTYERVTIDGVEYARYSSTNGNFILIRIGKVNGVEVRRYWTATKKTATTAQSLLFPNRLDSQYRYASCFVRAVSTTKGVDLGLPSGLKWMDCNVGASSYNEIGAVFAWGELSPKSTYSWATYKFNPSGDGTTFTKYNSTDGLTTLQIKY